MQSVTRPTSQKGFERKEITRLTPDDYAKAGILKSYDWCVKDREAHDKEMERYRQYLMKLCELSKEVTVSQKSGDE